MTAFAAWVGALLLGLLATALGYGRDALRGPTRLPAALRALAVTLLALVALDAAIGPPTTPTPIVALDASASMAARDGARWRAARDTAAAIPADRRLLVGDSVRTGTPPERPVALASRVADAVRQAAADARPLVLVTDGELDDAESLIEAPPGSRVVIVPGTERADLAVADLEAPAAVTPGDTVPVAVRVVARGARVGVSLRLELDGRPVAERPVPAIPSDGDARLDFAVPVPVGAPVARLAAVLVQPAVDAVPANDTVAVAIPRDRVARVAVVSTAPDADARDLVAVVRESAGVPVRAWYRVAPGRWVADGTLAEAAEADVRDAVRTASLVVLHGDTAWAGPPATLAARALLLVVPPGEGARDAYLRPAPDSPLQPALAALALDSLPPLLVGAGVVGGATALAVAPAPDARAGTPILRVDDAAPRRAILAAAGWSRWRRRGGAAGAAFQALLGAPLDWLVAARPRSAAPVPPSGVLRAGVPLRFARGSADTATLDLVRDGDRRAVRVPLDLRAGVAESPPLDVGTWRGRVGGAPVTLVVNAPGELLPRAATVRAGAIGGPVEARRRGARTIGWLYLAAALALAAEWLSRRRAGLR